MSHEEKEQAYEELIQARIQAIAKEDRDFAHLLVELSKQRYIDEDNMNECRSFLLERSSGGGRPSVRAARPNRGTVAGKRAG